MVEADDEIVLCPDGRLSGLCRRGAGYRACEYRQNQHHTLPEPVHTLLDVASRARFHVGLWKATRGRLRTNNQEALGAVFAGTRLAVFTVWLVEDALDGQRARGVFCVPHAVGGGGEVELTMKMSYRLCLISVLGLAACSSAQSDWQQSKVSDTVSAYQEFLQKHPNTPQSVEARNRVRALQDEEAWIRAQQVNTVQAYQGYIQEQPSGMHVAQAKDNIASSERATAWLAASATDTPESLEALLQKYPEGPEADKAKARLAELTGFRVQLATFHSEQQAEKTRDKLQGKYGDVLGSVVIVTGADTNLHVLQSAAMGQGEANNACAKLRRDHLPCEVIRDANS
jgi:hypothetical protein